MRDSAWVLDMLLFHEAEQRIEERDVYASTNGAESGIAASSSSTRPQHRPTEVVAPCRRFVGRKARQICMFMISV